MFEKQGNRIWFKRARSFFKIGKMGRVHHVVAAMAVCVTLAGPPRTMASDFTVDNEISVMQEITGDDETGTITATGVIRVSRDAEEAIGILASAPYTGITITNDGVISAEANADSAYGIKASNLTYSDMTISETGSITATSQGGGWASGIVTKALSNATVTNKGTMIVTATDGFATGIYAYFVSNDSSITNSGTMTIEVTNGGGNRGAFGIVCNGVDASTVENSSTMTVTANAGLAAGIYAHFVSNDSSITNSDTMTIEVTNGGAYSGAVGIGCTVVDASTVKNSSTMTVTANDGLASGIDMFYASNNSSVTNSGTLTVTSVGGSAKGISIHGDVYSSTVTNSGALTVTSAGGSAKGMFVGYLESNSTLENTDSGTIEVSSTDGVSSGMYVYGVYENSTMKNSGTINVTIPGDAATYEASGMKFGSMADSATIENAGTIEVTQGAGSTLNPGGYSFIAGVMSMGYYHYNYGGARIENSGTITVTGNSDTPVYGVYLSGYGVPTVVNAKGGTIQALNASGALQDGKFSVKTPGGLINEGTLKGEISAGDTQNSGLIRMPASDSHITGDFTQAAGGTLGLTLSSNDTPDITAHSRLKVTGTASLADGSGIDVDVATALEHQSLLIGSTLTGVVEADGGITADTDALDVTDNSLLVNFSAVLSDDQTQLNLDVEKAMSVVEATLDGGGQPVGGAAAVLDDLFGSGNTEIDDFLSSLIQQATAEGVARHVSQASPVGATQAADVSSQVASTMSAVVQARQQSVRGLNSGDPLFGDKNIWAKPFGARMDQEDADGAAGFSATAYGVGIGADGEYAPGSRLGLAFFYTRANAETNGLAQESDLDVFNLMAYGSMNLNTPDWNLFYQLGGGLQETEAVRFIQALGTEARADFTATNLFAQTKATRIFRPAEGVKAVAGASLSYAWFYNPDYTETGAGGMSLAVDSFDSQSLVAALEGDVSWTPLKDLELMASLCLGYDLVNDNQAVSSRFQGGGASFETEGIDNSPVVYSAGLGLAKKFTDRFSLDVTYDYEGRGDNFSGHMASAKLNWKF